MKQITKLLLVGLFAVLLLSARTGWSQETVDAAKPAEAAKTTVQAPEKEHGEKPGELVPVGEEAQHQALVQAIWVLIIFAVLLAILYPTAWKGVLAGLKEREHRIRKDIADAEATRKQAEETLKQYNQQLATAEGRVHELLAKAHADGEKLAATIRENAIKEAEQTKAKALADIDEAARNATARIYEEAAELGTTIAAKIIRKNLNADDQRELVRASLEQLQAARRN